MGGRAGTSLEGSPVSVNYRSWIRDYKSGLQFLDISPASRHRWGLSFWRSDRLKIFCKQRKRTLIRLVREAQLSDCESLLQDLEL
jgi:hypothetical protein